MAEPDFCRIILGDGYVEQTLQNIQDGKPMAVYDGGAQGSMFLGITINNIGVAFRIFAMGLVSSVLSAILLFYNGIMLGCFETFFAQHALLTESLLAVFMHGTLEISAIIVAGAAGLALGNSWYEACVSASFCSRSLLLLATMWCGHTVKTGTTQTFVRTNILRLTLKQ